MCIFYNTTGYACFLRLLLFLTISFFIFEPIGSIHFIEKARECLSRFLVNELIFYFSDIFTQIKTKSKVYDKVYDKNFALNLSD